MMEQNKCLSCKFKHPNKHSCIALNDNAFREACEGLYDCPFYKCKEIASAGTKWNNNKSRG